MLRAAALAERKGAKMRVVPLPPGSDPADLVLAEGPERMGRLLDASIPLVQFRIERVLAKADLRSPEGRDAALKQLKPILGEVAPGAQHDELLGLVTNRLNMPAALVAVAFSEAAVAPRPAQSSGPVRRLDPVTRAERAFLVQCLALPEAGREALEEVSEADFTSDLHRRALAHLRAHLDAPTKGVGEDEELAALIAELSVRAGQAHRSRAALEGETLKLELARLEREIAAARGGTGGSADITTLAARRREVRAAVDRAIDRVVAETQSSPET
jgi:DNA primase